MRGFGSQSADNFAILSTLTTQPCQLIAQLRTG